MADLSKIKAPDGTEVDIKDATARSGLSDKMDKANPTGTGALSINRKSGTTTGSNSVCLAENGTASSMNSTVFGYGTKATGSYSLAEGYNTTASGSRAHSEGQSTTASGQYAHAEGQSTKAYGEGSHSEGFNTNAGTSSDSNLYSHAEGAFTYSTGNASHSEGYYTEASGTGAHAEGKGSSSSYKTTASGKASHAEGESTIASGNCTHSEGYYTKAIGNYSHAEGQGRGPSEYLQAHGLGSHAEGAGTNAYGDASHAEGCYTEAGSATNTNHYSHAEGLYTQATGSASHAEGKGASSFKVTASGEASHAEGLITTASGAYSHAEGGETTASGVSAHAEGNYTTASGNHSHSEGSNTIASSEDQHVSGKFNVADSNNTYAEIIGNGTADNDRSNARTLDWGGNECVAGNVGLGGDLNFDECDSGYEKGIHWREKNYGDAFKIIPYFAGTDDSNALLLKTSRGGQGASEDFKNAFAFRPMSARGEYIVPIMDYTEADYDLPGTIYSGTRIYDSTDSKEIGCFQVQSATNGSITALVGVQNFDTSGNVTVNNKLNMYSHRDGSASISFTHPDQWRNAMFEATPDGSARDRVIYRSNKGCQVIDYSGSFNSEGNKVLKIQLPSTNWAKYMISVKLTANFTPMWNELVAGTNGSGALNNFAYYISTPDWTQVYGSTPTSGISWIYGGTNNLTLQSASFATWGIWHVRIITSNTDKNNIPNVYFANA